MKIYRQKILNIKYIRAFLGTIGLCGIIIFLISAFSIESINTIRSAIFSIGFMIIGLLGVKLCNIKINNIINQYNSRRFRKSSKIIEFKNIA